MMTGRAVAHADLPRRRRGVDDDRPLVPAGHRRGAGRGSAVDPAQQTGRDLERAPGLPGDPAGDDRGWAGPDRVRALAVAARPRTTRPAVGERPGAERRAAEPVVDDDAESSRRSDRSAAGHAVAPRRSSSAPRKRGTWRVVRRVVAAVLVIGWVTVLAWLRPFTAGPDALAALGAAGGPVQGGNIDPGALVVTDNPTTIELAPTAGPAPTTGLVFTPGARVDSRAYADLLRPVAEAGYLVVILKSPYGIAFAQPGQSAGPITDHPEITTWAVGGHSLGGVVAAGYAGDHADTVTGLLLYASYPNTDLSGDTDLQVESISGSNDGLTTSADIARTKDLLPSYTEFTVINGGVHAFFGDYGEQPGDGQSTVSREQATAEIVAATTAFLERVQLAGPG